VQNDRRVVEISQNVPHSKCVCQAMRYQDGGIDSNGFAGGWRVRRIQYSGGSTDETCQTKADPGGDGKLSYEIEPACEPAEEWCVSRRSEYSGPEIRSSAADSD
jgi:hypothetical protein